MALYTYRAINQSGKEIRATLTAESLALAKQKIYSSGLMLLSIQEKTSEDVKSLGGLNLSAKVNIADLSLMTRQLSTLLLAKIPIAEALSALVDQVDHPVLRVVLAEIRQKINEGASFAKALVDYPQIFNNIYVNMVEAGEASGTLHIVLARLAEFTEAQTKLKSKIISAMMYPMIMAFAGSVMMTFIFVVIIPKITRVFVSMKKELPIQTKICIWISNTVRDYWWLILMAIPCLLFLLNRYISSQGGQARWHALQLRLPIFGNLVKMINIGRFCSTLSTLLKSGVPIITALRIVKNIVSNVHIQEAITNSISSVSEGGSLAAPLANSGHFPPMVTHMIKLGEASGELVPMLEIIARNYEDQIETKLDGLTSVLEPIMMICLGGAVAFIVFSVVIPLMSLNSVRR